MTELFFHSFRCTADCGWITGHSYVSYGPLLNGATVVVFEGVIISDLVILSITDTLNASAPFLALSGLSWRDHIILHFCNCYLEKAH